MTDQILDQVLANHALNWIWIWNATGIPASIARYRRLGGFNLHREQLKRLYESLASSGYIELTGEFDADLRKWSPTYRITEVGKFHTCIFDTYLKGLRSELEYQRS